MARDFNGSTGYLVRTNSPITGYPFSMGGWVKFDTAAASQSFLSLDDAGFGTERFVVGHNGGGASVKFRCLAVNSAGSAGIAVGATTVSTGTWYHVMGVFRSTTDRELYVNGVSDATNTTSIAPAFGNIVRVRVGATAVTVSGVIQFWDGPVGECGVWNVTLSVAEISALARGVNPIRVRPSALVAYVPVHGVSSPENDMVNTGTYTVNGTAPYAAHPPVQPPFFGSAWAPYVAGGAAATGTLAGTTPSTTGSIAGNYGPRGTIVGTAPSTTGSFAGNVEAEGPLAGTTPSTTGAFAGVGGEDVVITPPATGGGKGKGGGRYAKRGKKQRVILPNGAHIWAYPDEIPDLLARFTAETRTPLEEVNPGPIAATEAELHDPEPQREAPDPYPALLAEARAKAEAAMSAMQDAARGAALAEVAKRLARRRKTKRLLLL